MTGQTTREAECRHCGRRIVFDSADGWIDPEATGDDVVWRETCDSHDTFEARHEPARPAHVKPEDWDGRSWIG